MILSGAGVETASIQTVAKVVRGAVLLEDITTQRFDIVTGNPLNCEEVPGFSRRIIQLEQ